MVSVRRRPTNVTSSRTAIGSNILHAGVSGGGGYHSSSGAHQHGGTPGRRAQTILRAVLVAFIVLQGMILTVRVIRRVASPPPSPSSSSIPLSTSKSSTWPKGQHNKQSTTMNDAQQPPHGVLRNDASSQQLRSKNDAKASGDAHPALVDPRLAKKDELTDADDGENGQHRQDGQVVDDHKADGEEVDELHPTDGKDHETNQRNQKIEAQVESTTVGATALGYVVDLVKLRQQPDFRKNNSTGLKALTTGAAPSVSHVSALAGGIPLQPCEYAEASTSGRSSRLLQRSACRDPTTKLVAYNPASYPRYRCGREIPANGVLLEKDGKCQESTLVFATQQYWQGGGAMAQSIVGVPPIVIKSYNSSSTHQPVLEAVECNVPCQIEQNLPPKGVRSIDGTNWKLVVNDADPYQDETAKPELTSFKRDDYYSSMSLRSSVPLSHYSFDLYNLRQTRALDWEKADNAATYLIDSNCNPYGLRRQKWYAAMAAGFTTRSYGKCDHNTDLGPTETIATMEGRLNLSKKNRIHLAFEASGEKDYTTSVVWESLLSGAVPAILGARNANEYLPKGSAILASSFNDWDKYAAHVKNVSETKELWETFHAWRSDEAALQEFESRFNFTRTTPQCRTCRWAYSKLHGLGWDHQQQQIVETQIPRTLCFASTSHLVVKPFREVWTHGSSALLSPQSTSIEKEVCQTSAQTSVNVVQQGDIKIDRSVVFHDGVIDMLIHNVEAGQAVPSDVVLQFHVNVRNFDAAYFSHPHSMVPTSQRGSMVSSAALQDERSKVTVLASWETPIGSPKQGVIEVIVLKAGEKMHADETKRIRIISEDTSAIHDKLTEYFPSSFAKQMILDFVDPVELFYTASK